jgi:hypothetical protein
MTGTLAFLVLFSLVERLRAIPLSVDGWIVVAVSCALLLLTCFEGAISCQTEINTGTSAAATRSAPDTLPPEHRPPRQRAQSRRRPHPDAWMRLISLQWLTQSASPSQPKRLLQRQAQRQPPSQGLSWAPSLAPRPSHHSATFPIPARGVSIASG